MEKEPIFKIVVLDKIIKYCIYSLVFLMPIFFLPWTTDVLDFNKQTLLILLGFIALLAWMLKVLVSKKLEVNKSKINIFVGALLSVCFLATVFSINRSGSFWGWPQSSSESLLSLIGLAVVYFLITSVFSKKDIFTGVIVLSISSLIAQLIGILQLFKIFIVPFDFAKTVSFNTMGTFGSLGFFTAIFLPLAIVMLVVSKKWWKVLYAAQIILSAILLFSINYHIIWWVVAAGSAVIMVFGIIRRDLFDGRWMSLPMFFLVVSLFFLLLNLQINLLPVSQRPNEYLLSQGMGLNIGFSAIKERPILGSGPGTFSYDFSKFKSPSLWNATSYSSSSKVLNSLATTGVLGLLALLAFMIAPIFYGVKFLFSQKPTQSVHWVLVLGILTGLAAQVLMCLLYNTNLALEFLIFFMVASSVVLIGSDKKEYELKPSSILILAVTLVFTLVSIFGLIALILDGQRYTAEVNYYMGLVNWQNNQKDAGTKNLLSAASLNSSSDLYFVQLSQAYLLLVQDELQNAKGTLSDAEKSKIQTYIANAVNSAKIATNLNPTSSGDLSNLGYVYQSLNGLIGDTSALAINSYYSALKLDPNNPYLLLQDGSVNFNSALKLTQDKASQKTQLLNTAKDELEKAISLNQNYSNALYYLGFVYDALGQKDKAITEFTKVQQLNPKDTTISKILSNLNSGLPALQQVTQQSTTPPATNSSSESTVKNPPATK